MPATEPPHDRSSFDVALVGGGVAGFACATRLAARGFRVALVEKRSVLGGRASSWRDRRSGTIIDNGSHLFAGAYEEVRRLLRRVGAADRVRFDGPLRVPLWTPDGGPRGVLATHPALGRLGSVWGMARFDVLSWADRLTLGRALRAALDGPPATDLPLGEWMAQHGQTAAARRWIWDPLVTAVFNEHPSLVSSIVFVEVLRRLLLSGAEASSLAHARRGLSEVYAEPSAAYLERCDGRVLRGREARRLTRSARDFALTLDDGSRLQTRAAVLAVSADGAHAILAPELRSAVPALETARRFPHAPLTSVHLWYEGDDPILDEPFVGFVDGPFAWCFDRTALAEDAPPAPRHLTLVAPADRAHLERTASELVELAARTLRAYAGTAADRPRTADRVVKEPRAALSLTPAVEAARPSGATRVPGLYLAGDWIATGLPATMESAARSGHRAAEGLEAFLRGTA